MPIAIDGTGTVTGISIGGLPDGIVDTDMLAANAVTEAKLESDVQQGLAKAWVNFDGDSGVGTIRSQHNVSSVTDHAAGDYTVNFSNNLANADYCVTGAVSDTAGSAGYRWLSVGSGLGSNFSKTTSGVRVQVANDSSNIQDASHVYVVVFGG